MSGRSFAVTGCASGIGAALAARLRAEGDRVIGLDVVEAEGVDEFIPLDLTDAGSVDRAAEMLTGPLDGICLNAGLPPREGLQGAILAVNVLGHRRFLAAAAPLLRAEGAVVWMASRAGQKWRENLDQIRRLLALSGPGEAADFAEAEGLTPVRAYDLSKEATIVYAMAASERLINRGLRINTVSPGAVATGILNDFAREFGERMHVNVARAGRPAAAEEVAAVAAFLLSPESRWLKGCDVPVDGGMGAFNLSDALGLTGLADGEF